MVRKGPKGVRDLKDHREALGHRVLKELARKDPRALRVRPGLREHLRALRAVRQRSLQGPASLTWLARRLPTSSIWER